MINGDVQSNHAPDRDAAAELRILILEDVPRDADLIERALRHAGIQFTVRRVDTRAAFLAALDEFHPDILLSDYQLPQFDGMEALRLLLERAPGVPDIIVTGSINEETAAGCIKAGATDYVIKHHLDRLGPAVRGALDTARARRAKEAADLAANSAAREWSTTFDAISDVICIFDGDQKVLRGNRAFCNLVGKDSSEILGRPCYQLVHGTDRPIEGCPFVAGLGARRTHTLELAAGKKVFRVRAEPLLDEEDLVTGWVHVMTDITESKRMQDQETLARKVLELLNNRDDVTETTADVLRMVKKDMGFEAVAIRLQEGDDFPYYMANGFSEDFLGTERYLCERNDAGEIVRDAMGNPVLECMCGNIIRRRTNPALPFFTKSGSFWTNSTTQLLATTTEANRQARTRNRCHGEGYESVALIPLRVGDKIIGLLQLNDHRPNRFTLEMIHFFEGLGASIGMALARKQAMKDLRASEKELRESAERHRTILHTAMDGFWIVDAQGRLLEVNDTYCRMSGYSERELLGMRIPDLEANETEDAVAAHLKKVITQGEDRFESRHHRKDGTILEVEISVQHKLEGNERLVVFLHDITGRKREAETKAELEIQLRQAQKMESVGRLAGGVAHDFNNMLGVILGYTEAALDQVGPDEPLHADLEEVRKAGRRAADLTSQLLAFARRQTIVPVVLDLNATVAGMLKMLQRLIGEDIELSWHPEASLWPVRVDPSQVDQTLVNLCLNARDAIAEAGKITIETSNKIVDENYCAKHAGFTPGDYVMLSVSDNGCGMDAQSLARIFEPFFTTKTAGKGTGLGLATAYGAIKQNNGYIDADSQPGRGTTLRIYLPRHTGGSEQIRQEHETPAHQRGDETILLVEDEPSILKLATVLLEKQGYTVLATETPNGAVRLAREHDGEIHLLMTDVVMPDMNGRDLAQVLLSINPHLKCLFMSGYTADIIANHGVLDERVNFIQKPFSQKDLAAKVREALDRN